MRSHCDPINLMYDVFNVPSTMQWKRLSKQSSAALECYYLDFDIEQSLRMLSHWTSNIIPVAELYISPGNIKAKNNRKRRLCIFATRIWYDNDNLILIYVYVVHR